MTLTDLPEIKALSAREKLELVDELWKSVAPELDSLQVSDEEKQILDKRWAAFLRNPAAALTPEQFKEQIKAHRP